MPTPAAHRPPPWYGWLVLALMVVGFAAWGGLVVYRSALLWRHMGDLDCYLRAAWAVRVEPDRIYDVMEDNAWHYNYPPLFAILMTPLADPPFAADRTGMPPFAVSVAIFYVLSLLTIALAVHILASALERSSPDPAVRSPAARLLALVGVAGVAGAGLPGADRSHADARPGQRVSPFAPLRGDGGGDSQPERACRCLPGGDGLLEDISGLLITLSLVAAGLAGRGRLGARPVLGPAAGPGAGARAGADGRLLPEVGRRADRAGPAPERRRLAGQGTHRGDGHRQPVVPRRPPQHAPPRPRPLAPAADGGAGRPLRPLRPGRPVYSADAGGREPAAPGGRAGRGPLPRGADAHHAGLQSRLPHPLFHAVAAAGHGPSGAHVGPRRRRPAHAPAYGCCC